MSDNTYVAGDQPSESEVIQGFREREKALKAELKEQESRIRAEIKRESDANALMPDGFKGLAGYFAQEVEGELTAEAANKWLAAKGVAAASPEPVAPTQETPAAELQAVTDLGSSVAAVDSQSAQTAFNEKLGEIETGAGRHDLTDVTASIAQLLEGQG